MNADEDLMTPTLALSVFSASIRVRKSGFARKPAP